MALTEEEIFTAARMMGMLDCLEVQSKGAELLLSMQEKIHLRASAEETISKKEATDWVRDLASDLLEANRQGVELLRNDIASMLSDMTSADAAKIRDLKARTETEDEEDVIQPGM